MHGKWVGHTLGRGDVVGVGRAQEQTTMEANLDPGSCAPPILSKAQLCVGKMSK